REAHSVHRFAPPAVPARRGGLDGGPPVAPPCRPPRPCVLVDLPRVRPAATLRGRHPHRLRGRRRLPWHAGAGRPAAPARGPLPRGPSAGPDDVPVPHAPVPPGGGGPDADLRLEPHVPDRPVGSSGRMAGPALLRPASRHGAVAAAARRFPGSDLPGARAPGRVAPSRLAPARPD